MFNVSFDRLMRITRLGALAVAALLVLYPRSLRPGHGHCDHPRDGHRRIGGVLPGATVTITNSGTKDIRRPSPTTAAATSSPRSSMAPTKSRSSSEGFKGYEQNIVAQPERHPRSRRDARSRQPDRTITVTAQLEIIQTETGAREGVLRAEQIDNLSVVSRSSLELLRIMPGVVAPDDTPAFESVSFGGGANNTQGYTVNGIRSSNNTVSLDGSALIDIGSNSGVIVTLNNDMVQEVKVQSSNFAAEFGGGGMNISAVTKAGSVAVPRHPLRLPPRPPSSRRTTARTHRGRREAEEQVQLPRRQRRRSDRPRRLQQEPRQGVLLRRLRGRSASRSTRARASASCRRSSSAPATSASSPPATATTSASRCGNVLIPPGSRAPAPPAPGNNLSPYTDAARPGAHATCIRSRTTSTRTTGTTTSTAARADQPHRHEDAVRLQLTNNTKAYVRVARENEDVEERARRVVGRVGRRAPVAEPRHEQGPVVRRQHRHRCSARR